jgi:hypothetical protein
MTPSTATPATEAMVADLSALGGAVARVAGVDIAYVAAPEQRSTCVPPTSPIPYSSRSSRRRR